MEGAGSVAGFEESAAAEWRVDGERDGAPRQKVRSVVGGARWSAVVEEGLWILVDLDGGRIGLRGPPAGVAVGPGCWADGPVRGGW